MSWPPQTTRFVALIFLFVFIINLIYFFMVGGGGKEVLINITKEKSCAIYGSKTLCL